MCSRINLSMIRRHALDGLFMLTFLRAKDVASVPFLRMFCCEQLPLEYVPGTILVHCVPSGATSKIPLGSIAELTISVGDYFFGLLHMQRYYLNQTQVTVLLAYQKAPLSLPCLAGVFHVHGSMGVYLRMYTQLSYKKCYNEIIKRSI